MIKHSARNALVLLPQPWPNIMCLLCCAVVCCAVACSASVLQSMSKLMQAGVRLWDRLHRHQEEAEGDDQDSLEHTSPAAAAPANSS